MDLQRLAARPFAASLAALAVSLACKAGLLSPVRPIVGLAPPLPGRNARRVLPYPFIPTGRRTEPCRLGVTAVTRHLKLLTAMFAMVKDRRHATGRWAALHRLAQLCLLLFRLGHAPLTCAWNSRLQITALRTERACPARFPESPQKKIEGCTATLTNPFFAPFAPDIGTFPRAPMAGGLIPQFPSGSGKRLSADLTDPCLAHLPAHNLIITGRD